jgi:hypothetical protein
MPIITLKVEHMRHTMAMMLTEYQAQFDEHLQAAVNRFCSPENLKRIIGEAVDSEMKVVIETEVRNFFQYGKGREAIKRAVVGKLEAEIAERNSK